MLKRLSLLAVTLVISIGLYSCSDSNLNQPVQDNNTSVNYSSNYSNSFQKENPLHKIISFQDNKVVSKVINGRIGGIIELVHIYKGKGLLNIKTVIATLIVPPGAFQGTREITLIDDPETASIYCYPSMVFDKPLYLNLAFAGIDIKDLGLTRNNVKFGYIREDGTVEPCVNSGITINPLRGLVEVTMAQVHHFSRYAFTR